MQKSSYKKIIEAKAMQLGFDACGFAKAEILSEDARKLEKWLHQGRHGKMSYMENYFDKRIDPTLLVEDAKTVITLLCNYFPEDQVKNDSYKVSKYAYGHDYHNVIKSKLKNLLQHLNNEIGEIHGRGFVDSAPVLERAWAVKSGLGWVGKNGNLISKQRGSFFFIATLIVDIEIETDKEFAIDYCGTCTKCIDACPTDAILPNKEINGSTCIAYFTIELKDALLQTDKRWNDWIFGCDICQDVCPWNRFSKPHQEPLFEKNEIINSYSKKDWQEITEDIFVQAFKQSPLKRSKFAGLKRNILFLQEKSQE